MRNKIDLRHFQQVICGWIMIKMYSLLISSCGNINSHLKLVIMFFFFLDFSHDHCAEFSYNECASNEVTFPVQISAFFLCSWGCVCLPLCPAASDSGSAKFFSEWTFGLNVLQIECFPSCCHWRGLKQPSQLLCANTALMLQMLPLIIPSGPPTLRLSIIC